MIKKGKSRHTSYTKMRSQLEDRVRLDLEERKIAYEYESIKLEYVKDTCPKCGHLLRKGRYTPDFIIERSSGIRLVVEVKGRFTSSDRTKMQRVKRDNPKEDIRFVFQRDQPLRKGSTTRYSEWSERNGFPWAIGVIPDEWIKESKKATLDRLEILPKSSAKKGKSK